MIDILVDREVAIRDSRKSFWKFCKALHGYKNNWKHLKILCDVLQQFFEGKLINKEIKKPYKKLMINLPPRHYKTRTMILFCCWILGVDRTQTIISTGYSDDLATEFSRYTRDEIQREKNTSYDIVYSDIFPETKIKKGDASAKKWALEEQHFSYLGSGFGASITGRGCKIAVIDDQIKNYEEACNEMLLDKKWEWYINTFKSRFEEGVKEIIIMTRWTDQDICGRILNDEKEKDNWYHLKMSAKDENGKMLCPDMLSEESYEEKRRTIGDDVFEANYNQNTIEKKGLLYQKFLEYKELPNTYWSRFCAIDVADQGDDYLCAVCGLVNGRNFYLLDVVYTKQPQEITEQLVVNMIINNKIRFCRVESNAGGRAFGRNIGRILNERRYFQCQIMPFTQRENKMARILSNSSNVENQILYPQGWTYIWREFARALKSFMRSKRNRNDDAPDALTMVIEFVNLTMGGLRGIKASDLGL